MHAICNSGDSGRRSFALAVFRCMHYVILLFLSREDFPNVSE